MVASRRLKPEYDAWIREHVKGDGYGQCAEVTLTMAAAFPDGPLKLTRVRGHHHCWTWGERTHWWLVDPDGQIVDPTVAQFPSHGRGVYTPWKEGDREPTGLCPNCGEYVYDAGTCCSDQCAQEYLAWINERSSH